MKQRRSGEKDGCKKWRSQNRGNTEDFYIIHHQQKHRLAPFPSNLEVFPSKRVMQKTAKLWDSWLIFRDLRRKRSDFGGILVKGASGNTEDSNLTRFRKRVRR